MCYYNCAIRDLHYPFCYLMEFGGRLKHFTIDAGQIHNKWLDIPFRINKGYEFINYTLAIELMNGDFGNAFFIILPAGSFYIEYRIHNK